MISNEMRYHLVDFYTRKIQNIFSGFQILQLYRQLKFQKISYFLNSLQAYKKNLSGSFLSPFSVHVKRYFFMPPSISHRFLHTQNSKYFFGISNTSTPTRVECLRNF